MKGFILYAVGVVAGVSLAAAHFAPYQSAVQGPEERTLAIEGVKTAYGSCVAADVFVRNLSRDRVAVEVYVEDQKDGSWTAVRCQYNVLDPDGRLVKRFRPTAIEPGASIRVRYDRCADYALCMKPKFPKASSNALRQMLEREDTHATAAVMQRIRVDAYVGSGASLREAGRFWSKPFARTPPGNGPKWPK